MDEIFSSKHFGAAVAVLALLTLIGFPMSYIIGVEFLGVYVTLKAPEGLTPEHSQWIGAWWLGYFAPACVVFVISLPMMLFPQQMPAAKVMLIIVGTRYTARSLKWLPGVFKGMGWS